MQISNVINKVGAAVSGMTKGKDEIPAKERQFGNQRRALTFGLYGCLVNYRLITHFVGQIGRENNINPELTERFFHLYLERIKYANDFMSYRDVLIQTMKFLDMEFSTKVFSANAEELYLLHADLRPHHEVVASLDNLRRKGFELYLMANSNIQLAQKLFESLGGFFDEKNTLVADECRCYKPRIEFFKMAVDKFKLRTADHFHVSSDYFQDIVPANRLHWLTAYVNRSKTGVLEGGEPSVVISSLAELEAGMDYAQRKIEAEEQAAKERELAAQKEAQQAEAKAQQEARMRQQQQMQQQQMQQQQMRQQQMPQQQMQQQQMRQPGRNVVADITDDLVDFGNQYFEPQTDADRELAAKMQNMNPAKARALAKARGRAMMTRRGPGL